LVGAVAEQSHDVHGLIWPREIAPADVHVVIAGKDETVGAIGERLAAELDSSGLRVILDDRPATPGVKFADAELLGVPTILVVGRGLASGVVEVKDRATGERTEVPMDGVVAHLHELCSKEGSAGQETQPDRADRVVAVGVHQADRLPGAQ
jgi:prolyl-tRNA synthetase